MHKKKMGGKGGGKGGGDPLTTIFGILSICFVHSDTPFFLFRSFPSHRPAGGLIMFKGT
jgi:hypothetical protein